MHFGENQLSRSLIGLSPLTTGHPPTFQRWWVRPSTRSYPRFSLPMARSPRFGSRTRDSNALIGLAFATAPPPGLTSPRTANSQAHSSKGTPSPHRTESAKLRRIVGRRFQVLFHSPPGVLFTFPSRYSSAIGHQEVFRLTRWSWQIHGRLQGSAATREHIKTDQPLSPTGLSPSTVLRPNRLQLATGFLTARPVDSPNKTCPTTPHTQPLPGITRTRFSLLRFRSPLLTESLLFSLPTGTEMFHFPAFPPTSLCIQLAVTPHNWCRVTPFGHPGITARLTAPPGLSRPPTSFIGSWCQGIHRTPSAT